MDDDEGVHCMLRRGDVLKYKPCSYLNWLGMSWLEERRMEERKLVGYIVESDEDVYHVTSQCFMSRCKGSHCMPRHYDVLKYMPCSYQNWLGISWLEERRRTEERKLAAYIVQNACTMSLGMSFLGVRIHYGILPLGEPINEHSNLFPVYRFTCSDSKKLPEIATGMLRITVFT